MSVKSMKNIKNAYNNLLILLEEKAIITQGEVQNIIRAANYTIAKDMEENNSDYHNSQFLRDSNLIKESLIKLLRKINKYKEDIEKLKEDIKSFDVTFIHDNIHLQILLKLDCMQNRSFDLSEKLEYLYRAYENLISPYNLLYLPLPSISKRIKTSNLMLFFNQELNDYNNVIKELFFKVPVEKYSKDNPIGVFSTWNFSSADHVKDIDDSGREFISLSFWFYEKQIFYPIAFHEISHF